AVSFKRWLGSTPRPKEPDGGWNQSDEGNEAPRPSTSSSSKHCSAKDSPTQVSIRRGDPHCQAGKDGVPKCTTGNTPEQGMALNEPCRLVRQKRWVLGG